MFRASSHQLLDTVKALWRRPVCTQKMRIACRQDVLVGRGVPALGLDLRGVQRRVLCVGNPTLPVVLCKPTRRGGHTANVIGGPTNRHFTDGLESHLPLCVGHHHALHGCMVTRKSLCQLRHTLGPIGLHACVEGEVVGRECRPSQADGVGRRVEQSGVLRLNIADDRAMSCAAHSQAHIALPFDANVFLACFKRGPTLGRSVLTRT